MCFTNVASRTAGKQCQVSCGERTTHAGTVLDNCAHALDGRMTEALMKSMNSFPSHLHWYRDQHVDTGRSRDRRRNRPWDDRVQTIGNALSDLSDGWRRLWRHGRIVGPFCGEEYASLSLVKRTTN